MRTALIALALLSAPPAPEPGLVIVCRTGAVYPKSGQIANGTDCVAHDRHGNASGAQFMSAYDDSEASP